MKQRQLLRVTRTSPALQRQVSPAVPAARGWSADHVTAHGVLPTQEHRGYDMSRFSVYAAGQGQETTRLGRQTIQAPIVYLTLDDEPLAQAEAGVETAAMAEPAEELAGEGAQPSAEKKEDKSCGEKVTWEPDSPVPVDINADSPVEFINAANQALGNPHMNGSESHDMEIDSAGRVVKVNMKVTTSIVRPRWSGGRKVSDADKELIQRMVAFIKAHEERHRDAYRKVMQDAVCAALGKPSSTAQATITKASCTDTPAAHEAIDAKEGKLELVTNSAGAVTDFKAVGVTVSYKDKECK